MEILYLLVGLVFGVIIHSVWTRINNVGRLRIDRSDATDAPYLFLEATKSIPEISRKRYVIFRVSNENFISQK